MTVQELIDLLATLSKTAEVVFHDEEIGIYEGDTTIAQINEKGALLTE